MYDATGNFLKRAGTLILASMVVVWALLYFPRGESDQARAAFVESLRVDGDSVREEADKAEGDEKAAKEKELAEKTALRERVERDGLTYDVHHAYLRKEADDAADEAKEAREAARKGEALSPEQRAKIKAADDAERKANEVYGEWQRDSVLGRTGRLTEPAVR